MGAAIITPHNPSRDLRVVMVERVDPGNGKHSEKQHQEHAHILTALFTHELVQDRAQPGAQRSTIRCEAVGKREQDKRRTKYTDCSAFCNSRA